MEDDENFTLTIDESSLPINTIFIGDVTTVTITIANDDCKSTITLKANEMKSYRGARKAF